MIKTALDKIDEDGHSKAVVELTRRMRLALKGDRYEIGDVLKNYNKYFDMKGFVNTQFGRMKKERWEMLIEKKAVIFKDGKYLINGMSEEYTGKDGKTHTRLNASRWFKELDNQEYFTVNGLFSDDFEEIT